MHFLGQLIRSELQIMEQRFIKNSNSEAIIKEQSEAAMAQLVK
jgi:hypothetical protein